MVVRRSVDPSAFALDAEANRLPDVEPADGGPARDASLPATVGHSFAEEGVISDVVHEALTVREDLDEPVRRSRPTRVQHDRDPSVGGMEPVPHPDPQQHARARGVGLDLPDVELTARVVGIGPHGEASRSCRLGEHRSDQTDQHQHSQSSTHDRLPSRADANDRPGVSPAWERARKSTSDGTSRSAAGCPGRSDHHDSTTRCDAPG